MKTQNPYTTPSGDLTSRKLGGCLLEKKIATGGMGTVYRASSAQGKEVAVKVLSPALAADPTYLERFFREIRILSSIHHPNVVRVLDAGEEDKNYYLVMEYIQGEPLSEVIRKEKRMRFQKAAIVVREVAKGLAAGHAKGVVHRDVKPQNILVDRGGRPKLIDFGLAREAGNTQGLTQEGLMMGTPEYMSPEQAEGLPVDVRTDVYSLGVTFYQLLSGKFPFSGETSVAMALQRLQVEPRALQDAFPGVDPKAPPIVAKMLARERKDRFQNMAEVVKEIDRVLSTTMKLPKIDPAAEKPGFTRRGRRIARAAMFGACFLAAAALWTAAGVQGGRLLAGRGGAGTLSRLVEPVLQEEGRNDRLTLLGLGVLAFLTGAFVYRRDLLYCGRGAKVFGLAASALALCYLAAVQLHEPYLPLLTSPANRLALGGLLVGVSAVLGFLKVGPRWPRVLVAASVPLVYAGAVGTDLAAGVRGISTAPEVVLAFGVVAFFSVFFGGVIVTAEDLRPPARWTGLLLLVMGLAALYAMGAMGLDPTGQAWRSWGLEAAKSLPAPWKALHGGTMFVAASACLFAAGVLVRIGIAKSDAFYGVKE